MYDSNSYCITYYKCPTVDSTDEYLRPPYFFYRDGIRVAAKRHDALARKKYAKPFKQFKFNRARRQRP